MPNGDTITCSIGVLQYASFRGVPFWVKTDEGKYGRRNAHHEYPKGDLPFNEDMGRKQREFNVSGYVVGDDARQQKDALIAAAETYGGGMLVLPAEDPQQCVINDLTVTRNKDDQGIWDVKFNFKEDPTFISSGFFGGSAFEGLIGGVLNRVAPFVTSFFNDTFSTTNVQQYVVDNTVARTQAFAQTMLSSVEALALPSDKRLSKLTTDLIGLYQNADVYVRPGPATAVDSTLPAVVARVFDAVTNVQNPAITVEAMQTMAFFSVIETASADGASYPGDQPLVSFTGDKMVIYAQVDLSRYSPSEAIDAENAAAFNGMVRIYGLIGLAKGLAASTFTDRPTAIQARANLVELFQAQMERTMSYDIALALEQARDHCVRAITAQIASIEPLIHVACPISLPSLYWAGRLYDDASRALELSERNLVRTPAYMPQGFDALAR